jgi:hypothetical protein
MAAVDRVMAERFGVDVLQLMELAGQAVAGAARAMLPGGDPRGRRVLVLAGRAATAATASRPVGSCPVGAPRSRRAFPTRRSG